jgi:hypothetical protein
MKMRKTSRVQNKESAVNNNLLKHGAHIQIAFDSPHDFAGDDGFIMGTRSDITLLKSKLCPKIKDIPCIIDARAGGKIDEVGSFVEYLCYSNVGIIKTGSWYNMTDTIDKMAEDYPSLKSEEELLEYRKNIRRGDIFDAIRGNSDMVKFLEVSLIDFINGIFPLQKLVNEEYKESIMRSCKYFNNEFNSEGSNQENGDNADS